MKIVSGECSIVNKDLIHYNLSFIVKDFLTEPFIKNDA